MNSHAYIQFSDIRNVAELINYYKKRQGEDRVSSGSKCRSGPVKKVPSKCYSVCCKTNITELQINGYITFFTVKLCPIQRVGRFSYQMMSPGKVQISGFCDTDNYTDVLTKGANGLNISANSKSLKLLVSGGLVSNFPLQDGKEWTLGQYTIEIGGVQIRSKKIFGIYNPPYVPESVSCDSIIINVILIFLYQFTGDLKDSVTPARSKQRGHQLQFNEIFYLRKG